MTSGGQFSGRDSYNFHAPVIITGQPPVLPPVSADLTPARDAYLAYRRNAIYDGNPPDEPDELPVISDDPAQ